MDMTKHTLNDHEMKLVKDLVKPIFDELELINGKDVQKNKFFYPICIKQI